MPLVAGDFIRTVESLVNYATNNRRYFGTAPMRLAAAVTLMDGGNTEYVFGQYKALVTLEYEAMSRFSQLLLRQVDSGKANTSNQRATLARGLKVFDIENRNLQKMYISDCDISSATARVARVVLETAKRNGEVTQ
jgi:hypothetical protein